MLILAAGAAHAQVDESIKSGSGLGSSGRYNPDIGVNLLFLGKYLNSDKPVNGAPEEENGTGLEIQEVEFSFSAGIDPYFLGQLTMAVEGEEIHIEEGYATLLAIPMITVKAGKFFTSFGRHNTLHSHSFPFIDPPLILSGTFGDDGLLETGVSVSFLAPLPWFLEITGEVLNGNNEIFSSPKGEDLAYLLNLKTLFDLSEDATIQFGGSFVSGKNSYGWWSSVYGADITLKWRPLKRARYLGITFQNEYMARVIDLGAGKKEKTDGLYSLLMLQFARQWWIEGRYDLVKAFEGTERAWRASGLVAFVPTEFSALRLQYNYNKPLGSHEVMFQLNVTFGNHPAHGY